jgi:glycosyltransferase involved in cell wall biosynthesis
MSTVSIIISTLNEEHHIAHILNNLFEQTEIPEEIIVVDAGSTDQTVKIVQKYSDVKIVSSHPPVAWQRSVGGHAATSDILIFFDADVEIKKNFISAIKKVVVQNKLDLACPLYLTKSHNIFVQFFLLSLNALFVLLQFILPSGGGNCIIVKKNTFQESAGFDPSLTFDDIELIRRLSKKNHFGVIFEPVYISDRRFAENGFIPTFFTYMILCVFFTFGLFKQANIVKYKMGKHQE